MVKVEVEIVVTLKYSIFRYFVVVALLRLHQTSNVFVANLPSHVTEQSLGMFFARIGPVGSVSDNSPPPAECLHYPEGQSNVATHRRNSRTWRRYDC